MKLVIYSPILNNHQANVADELWERTDHKFCFVELAHLEGEHRKGDDSDYSGRPYLLKAWESETAIKKAMSLSLTADCCIFSGILALPFQKARMKAGLLSFDMSERWLKRGMVNLLSPAILKMFLAYHIGGWQSKPIYKLCCSSFAAKDQSRLGTYKGKCYKWGYFPATQGKINVEISSDVSTLSITPLMWCSRYLMLKHPELPVLLAHRLKSQGYKFTLDMYGSGEYLEKTKILAAELKLGDIVRFPGTKPNPRLLEDMSGHEIFLFTSDRKEGWGAVANESMSCGCALVASDSIGSTAYLIDPGKTGLVFKGPEADSTFDSPDQEALDDLCQKVRYLLDHPQERREIRQRAAKQMQEIWSPAVAASRLLALIESLKNGQDSPFSDGPCSKA